MFSLTEGTLFFLDLALSARIRDEKPSLSNVVQTWVNGVATATHNSANGADTPTGACSILSSREFAPQNARALSKASFPAEDLRQVFAPSHVVDDRAVMSHHGSSSVGTSGMGLTIATSDSDSDCCSPGLDAPLPQRQHEAPIAVKRKVDDADMESDASGDDDMDVEEPVPEDPSTAATRGRTHTPSTTPMGVTSRMLPPQKRIKYADASVPDRISAACMAQPQALQRRRLDNDGYIIEVIKKRSEYTQRDLPVPCDQRWSHSFISTAILWYGVQKNIWNVPKDEFASALQRIFNVVYPGIKYRVTPTGSVFALTMQRIDEWRSSFGSSALAMMLHFFSALDDDDDDDIHAAAEFLATDCRFLREDPDALEPTELFRSAFLLILLAITHLGDIAASVDVPVWDTRAMAAGEGGEGVIAIASAALERALTFFRDGTLDVDHVLANVARCPDTPTTPSMGALPETVFDALAGRDAPPALRFSSANWRRPTAAYRESVRKRGTAFVRGTFAAAQVKRQRIVPDEGSEAGMSGVGES